MGKSRLRGGKKEHRKRIAKRTQTLVAKKKELTNRLIEQMRLANEQYKQEHAEN
jgi:excinuclease UvrABC nuclease subunit